MKSSESKTTAAKPASTHRGEAGKPFFQKDGQGSFFSEDSRQAGFFFGPSTIQPKLTVGKPGDQYEREADAVAERVVRQLSSQNSPEAASSAPQAAAGRGGAAVQAKCAGCEKEEMEQVSPKEESIQRKPIFESAGEPQVQAKLLPSAPPVQRQEQPEPQPEEEAPLAEEPLQAKPAFSSAAEPPDDEDSVQRQCAECAADEKVMQKSDDAPPASPAPSLEARLGAAKGGGSPLPDGTRSQMEGAMGADFSGVRVHDDSSAVQMSQELGAQAFAHGSDIYFNAGKYDAGSAAGKTLLAHELTHVVQQGKAQKTVQRDLLDDAAQLGSDIADSATDMGRRASQTASRALGSLADTASSAVDWLSTTAGQMAQRLATAFGGTISLSTSGITVLFPRICPVGAMTLPLQLPTFSKEFMLPLAALPLAPNVALTGRVGVVGRVTPSLEVQLGPVCLEGVRIFINPLTMDYDISGSMSATGAATLSALLRGGARGDAVLQASFPFGTTTLPLIGLEGGLSAMIRGTGAGRATIGSGFSFSGGAITNRGSLTIDLGLAADLYGGAYARLDRLGRSMCDIFFQLKEWHGGLAHSLNLSYALSLRPGTPPIFIPRVTAAPIPFGSIPVSTSRDGFTNNCPNPSPPLRACEPANSLLEAELLHAWASKFILYSGFMFESGTTGLWTSYFNKAGGIPRPTQAFGAGTGVAAGFRAHHRTREVERLLVDEAATRLAGPRRHLLPSAGSSAMLRVEDVIPANDLLSLLNNPGSPMLLDYDQPATTIPGNIAGGVGRGTQGGGPPGNAAFDQDERNVAGFLLVQRKSARVVVIKSMLTFLVHDTVDFCPGNLGDAPAPVITLPMSVLEATGGRFGPVFVADVPFDVKHLGLGVAKIAVV